MADTSRPNPNANKQKADGEAWSSEPDTVQRVGEDAPAENSPGDGTSNAGGITNRPLDREVGNQDALPPRGMTRDEEDAEE